MSVSDLNAYRLKDLAEMARERGVPNWDGLRKAELVAALAKLSSRGKRPARPSLGKRVPESKTPLAKPKVAGRAPKNAVAHVAAPSAAASQKNGSQAKKGTKTVKTAPKKATPPTAAQRRIRRANQTRQKNLDLANVTNHEADRDHVMLLVRDAFWLQAAWEISPASVERAQAALAELWLSSVPVLRLVRVQASAHHTETVLRYVPIRGTMRTWFLEVDEPPSYFRVEIGYLAPTNRFHSIARSNTVRTPTISSPEGLSFHRRDLEENADRILSLSSGGQEHDTLALRHWFEERVRRTLGSPLECRMGADSPVPTGVGKARELNADAELLVFGSADPRAEVTVAGEPVKLYGDGTFCVRVPMSERRQIVPVVAVSRHGGEEQTIVLAVERNTKKLGRRVRRPGE